MAETPLQQLITLDEAGGSDERRALLRSVTDSFIVASDRYGRREMVLFDMLLSRTATVMDNKLRKVIAMSLVRAGAREEHVRHALRAVRSPNERFLRRSTTQTLRDLYTFVRENSDPITGPIDFDETLTDGNGLRLPAALVHWLYQYQVTTYRNEMIHRIGADRCEAMSRATERLRPGICEAACEGGREEVLVARRTIKDWVRRQSITDDLLVELLEARAMTEFIFACTSMFDIDSSTMFRVLNDTSFESLAVMAKAHDVRRSVFARTVYGFRHRKSDSDGLDYILPIYDRLPRETALRAIRFWRVRVGELSGAATNAPQQAVA